MRRDKDRGMWKKRGETRTEEEKRWGEEQGAEEKSG